MYSNKKKNKKKSLLLYGLDSQNLNRIGNGNIFKSKKRITKPSNKN